MTEHLIYSIYKISNDMDKKVYIGSTRRPISTRFTQHCYQMDKKDFPLYCHMRQIGKDHFKVECVKTIGVSSKTEARKIEQQFIESEDQTNVLNALKAFSENREKTRDQDKKRKTRRDFYQRHKLDSDWVEKERERNRLRMKEKRRILKEQTKDM